MSEPQGIPRAISAIVLTYCAALLSCFIWLGLTMKLFGYQDGNPHGYGWTWSAVFLREWILLFALLPVAWACYALHCYRVDHGWRSADAAIAMGWMMTIFVSLWFAYAAFMPINRIPLLRVQEPPQTEEPS